MTLGGDLIAEGDLTSPGISPPMLRMWSFAGDLTTSSSVGMSINADGDVMVGGNLNAFSDLSVASTGQMEVRGT